MLMRPRAKIQSNPYHRISYIDSFFIQPIPDFLLISRHRRTDIVFSLFTVSNRKRLLFASYFFTAT